MQPVLFALNDVSVGSPIQQRLTCDGRIKMVPCHHRSIIDSAAAIARQNVHVLVDLGGCDPVEPVREAVKAYPFDRCAHCGAVHSTLSPAHGHCGALKPSAHRRGAQSQQMAFGFRPIDCASHSVPFHPIRFHSSALFRSAPLCCAVLRLPNTTVAGSINPCSYTQGARPEVFALRAAPLTVGANSTISAYSTASASWRCCQALVRSDLR